jgi:hypothetical protein
MSALNRFSSSKPILKRLLIAVGDLRDDFLNDWFGGFFETNTPFENFPQQNQVNSRQQPFKSWDR